MMHDERRRGGLSARLAISYLLVMLLATGVLVIAFAAGTAIVALPPAHNTIALGRVLAQRVTPSVTAYLMAGQEDAKAAHLWTINPLITTSGLAVTPTTSLVALLDRNGTAVIPPCATSFVPRYAPQTCADITAALGHLTANSVQSLIQYNLVPTNIQAQIAYQQGTRDINLAMPDSGTLALVPLLAYNAQSFAVYVAVLNGPVMSSGQADTFDAFLGVFTDRLRAINIPFILLAMAASTLAAIVIARHLARRLRQITVASDEWSAGRFHARTYDFATDEIGQLAQNLNRMAGQIQTLLRARQTLAVTEERNRLARELHDAVKQHVFANALLVRAARKQIASEPQLAVRYLNEAAALADQAQAELIALIGALRPAAFGERGLVMTLEDYVADWARRTGIAGEIHIQGARSMPLECEDVLFRVAQEGLANVARHSGARNVAVRLVWEKASIHLTIQDNGKGFARARPPQQGLGLVSMRERVEALQGTLVITSDATGTLLTAMLPVVPAYTMAREVDYE